MTDLPTVRIDGAVHSYEDVPGETGRAPLLFLHEGLGSVGLWRGFHHRIAAATGRRAVAFSRLGHGWSDPPSAPRGPGFMESEATDVVPALCAALGLERPILVGHSDGASIALLHAAAYDLPGLVVLAPHTFVEEAGLREIEATRGAYADGLRERIARHHRDPDVVFRNWNDVWLHPAFRTWDIRPRLAGITCPVLAVQGTADPYGTVAHVESVREHARGPVEVVLLDCGHSPHLERPEETDAAVARFLSSLP
ncbi:alpha/beta fold hydrolase [Pseudonocardia sp.]|uniref:alpha/beta fold hydrolase n=1 Tax=Pseudonocardia sp. TaxID=60912 RepID=UPI003D0D6951